MELFFEILLCSLAVFGLWCLARLVAETVLGARQIAPSVTLRTQDELENAYGLLEEARVCLSCRRGSRIVVLCDASVTENGRVPSALEAACRRFRADCYVVHTAETKLQEREND